MIELRDYQHEAIAAVADRYRQGVRRPLVSLPTGTGKTVIFASLASRAMQRGNGVLVLAHRDELLTQAADKMRQVDGRLDELAVGLVKAEADQWDRPVVVASVQTLGRQARLDRVTRKFALIIVDEAHHAAADSYQRILKGLGSFDADGPLTLGVTATPQRADSLSLDTTFQEVVYHRDILSMIRAGYLCDLKGVQIKLDALDLSGIKTRGGDYVEGQVAQALEAAEAPLHGVRAWRQYASSRKTIVFTPTIALAHEFAAEFRKAGVRAEGLSGETPRDERRRILADLHTGAVQVVCNAQVLTEGFDEPSVDCIMIARPTKSQPLYVQMVGRGTRIYPGKDDCLVMDLVGATERMDLTTLPRLFGLGDDEPTLKEVADVGVAELAGQREAALVREGKISAQEVELFKAQKLVWAKAGAGAWALPAGDDMLIVRAQAVTAEGAEPRYRVELTPRHGGIKIIGHDLDLGYAQGLAEDAARQRQDFNEHLVDRDAGWRQAPATDKQIKALKRLGVKCPAEATRGEASVLMASAIAAKRVAGR
jgi:ATP-dependent helicase IRC3